MPPPDKPVFDFSTITEHKEDYDPNEVREAYIAKVKAEGLIVVLPKANELQIDIDTDAHYTIFKDQMDMLARNLEPKREAGLYYVEAPSKGGPPGRHITVTLPFTVSPTERIAFQASLGSDPKRELLSLLRKRRGDIHPTLFVEKETR